MEPLIPKGAALRLQEEPEYLDGDIVLLTWDTGSSARRIMRTAGQIILLPINPKYKLITLNESDVQFVGRVESVAHHISRS
jgi:SOS-response transcriptional repressor LexA